MDIATYAVEAEAERNHWWFVGRRRLFAREICRLGLSPDAAVLDIGTSTGTNLRLLQELGFTNVTGLDSSEEAIRFCAEKGLGRVQLGDILKLPFPDDAFDLILTTDVVEHVDDDQAALRSIARVLKPGGVALLTAPAFQVLWGLQDNVSQHKRRYTKKDFLSLALNARLKIVHAYYFNFILFAPIFFARQILRLLGTELRSENQVNTPFLNAILSVVFGIDVEATRWISPPFGVSILALVRKEQGRLS